MSAKIYSQEDITKIVVSLLGKYGAEHAILFGSYARGEANEASDIDLVVIGGELFDPTNVFCIADELHRITEKQVDVYELCEIDRDSDFYDTIFSEGVQIA